MPSIQFDAPHTLVSPRGSLDLNTGITPGVPRYVIVPDGYKVVPSSLRVTTDPISQQDGSVPHPRYKDGYVASLAVEFHVGDVPACRGDAVDMNDALLNHLDALTTPTPGSVVDQRLLWTPSGHAQRMLDEILILSWADPSWDGVNYRQAFSVESPFPYAVNAAQTVTPLGGSAGGSVVVNNAGTAKAWPVFLVNGATSAFTITNATTGLAIVYAGTAIGGGHFVEIDAFRGSAYLDGDVLSRLGSVDPTATDFFPLVPGNNTITISGASASMLWNVAWS